ncbi:hypothetical protein NMY22_g14045 [Coprinellus aureogranulatus]|nr:hypothetical protein NMY22_g14045 [Coprinellus aureogranulatus]
MAVQPALAAAIGAVHFSLAFFRHFPGNNLWLEPCNPPRRRILLQNGWAFFKHRTAHHFTSGGVHVHVDSSRSPLDRLEKNVAHGAAHDSAERGFDAPKCHPETRIAVQQEIMSWIEHGSRDANPRKIMWLSGPAGSGKTAIAGAIADECQDRGWLAASFFFSAFAGSPQRRMKRFLVPTLVYHLIHHETIPDLKGHILSAIADNPSIFRKRLERQLKVLILDPIRNLSVVADRDAWPKVIVIDGLDECDVELRAFIDREHRDRDLHREKESIHREILSVLAQAVAEPTFPFRIFLASRPESAIADFFHSSPGLALELFLDDKYNPNADITLFLEAKFAELRRQFSLGESWPSKDTIALLVKEASGQFIYAATVIRFIQDSADPPSERLARILEWRRYDTSKPFAPLDSLYKRILQTSPKPFLAAKWLCAIDALHQNWPTRHLATYLLGSLASLIALKGANGHRNFQFYHKSLIDFLNDGDRSEDLCVAEAINTFLRDRFYELLKTFTGTSRRERASPNSDHLLHGAPLMPVVPPLPSKLQDLEEGDSATVESSLLTASIKTGTAEYFVHCVPASAANTPFTSSYPILHLASVAFPLVLTVSAPSFSFNLLNNPLIILLHHMRQLQQLVLPILDRLEFAAFEPVAEGFVFLFVFQVMEVWLVSLESGREGWRGRREKEDGEGGAEEQRRTGEEERGGEERGRRSVP